VPEFVRALEEVLRATLAHARGEPHQECCGLLAGRHGVIVCAFAATNVASHPATSYEIAPREIFSRIREMRAAGLELLGIYHSHPSTANEPSPRDVESAYYPDAAYFILSPFSAAPRPVRAFSIRDGQVKELEIEIVSNEALNDQSA
jgi:[CysO sulfur-carrier protein]-S-L-cysteine hydrolase